MKHATVEDLPEWPTGQVPNTVNDLTRRTEGWGGVILIGRVVLRDRDGRLWLRRDEELRAHYCFGDRPYGGMAWVYATPDGLGLYLRPKAYREIGVVHETSVGNAPAESIGLTAYYAPVTEICADPKAMPFYREDQD